MATHAGKLIGVTLICQALLASGCSVVGRCAHTLASCSEVIQRKAEVQAGRHQANLNRKLATQEDRLQQQVANTSTAMETTMAMDINQSLEFEELTVDVEELKRVIVQAEARARAEALRQRRQPQLLRDQQEALRQGAAAVLGPPELGDVQPAQFDGRSRPGTDADMVVGIDQFGNPLPFVEEPALQLAPWEIPFNMRVRLNLGVNNPRVSDTRVRRRPLNSAGSSPRCGKCKSGAAGCDECSPAACLSQLQQTSAVGIAAETVARHPGQHTKASSVAIEKDLQSLRLPPASATPWR